MQACLDENLIARLVCGRLSDDELSATDEHIDVCSACRELVAEAARARTGNGGEPAPRPTVVERGSHVGRYVVLDAIGAGGMGVVYAATDPELHRRVALKVVHTGDDDARARVMREAQAIARLSHPNVIAIFDIGTMPDAVFFAMELVEGETLSTSRARPWSEIRDTFLQAGEGLAAAHAAGIVHRDFKPDNVLVGKDGRVRVCDFGIARPPASGSAIAGALAPSGNTRGVAGTPGYMAPEQMRGERTDASADVFSFCVVLHEALHGVRPFEGETIDELRRAIDAGKVVTRAPVPGWLERAVRRGLSARPADRQGSMGELLKTLRAGGARRSVWAAVAIVAVLCVAGVQRLARSDVRPVPPPMVQTVVAAQPEPVLTLAPPPSAPPARDVARVPPVHATTRATTALAPLPSSTPAPSASTTPSPPSPHELFNDPR